MTFESLLQSNTDVQLVPVGASCHQKPKRTAFPVRDLPSQERLRELFDYDPSTGNLIWKARPLSEFKAEGFGKTWNSKFAGVVAGTTYPTGYVVAMINHKGFYAHRLIWVWCNGFIPTDLQIDHIDGNPSNNRIVNLRLATPYENHRNSKIPCNNTSGIKGVKWHTKGKKWCAQIRRFGKEKYLGLFENIEDAAAAYAKASEEISEEFTHSSTRIHKRETVQLETSVFQGDE